MNYLGHAFLSFGRPDILAGNMAGDFVKGKLALSSYPDGVRKGLLLHRAIDNFADHHAAAEQAKELFRKDYRLYAGAFVDILYDHFLARDLRFFPNEQALKVFTEDIYNTLLFYLPVLPSRFRQMFEYMQRDNWLYGYYERAGMQQAFKGLVHRARHITDSGAAFHIFNEHYDYFEENYRTFIPGMINFVKNELTI